MIIFGLASALYGPTRFSVMSDIYPEFDGTAIGITQAAGEAGNGIFPFIAAIISVYSFWQLGILYIVPLFFITAIGLQRSMPKRTSSSGINSSSFSINKLKDLFKNINNFSILSLLFVITVTSFALQAVSSFYPTYLVNIKGVSPVTAAILFSLLFFSAIIIQPVSGAIGDTLAPQRMLLGSTITFALGLLLFPFVSSLYSIIIVTIMLSSFFAIPPIIIPQLLSAIPADIQGTGLGFLRSCYLGIAATGSFYMGFLGDKGLFVESFLLLSISVSCAFILSTISIVRS